ncbi:MAG: nodulation protein NfeD, partial [Desulfobacteraceae bacterium]
GRVRESTRPETPGKVFVHGEIWNARSEEILERGTIVEVVGIDHLLLTVKKRAG